MSHRSPPIGKYYGEVVAPAASIPPPQLSASNSAGLSNRKRHGFVPPNVNPSSVHRRNPQNSANVADVYDVTKISGENDVAHTPSQAGRALPHGDGRTKPRVFDTCQDSAGATAPAGSASRAVARGVHPREAAEPGQRPPSLTDAAALIRAARLRDLLAAIAEWERASGPDRRYWRYDAQHRLREWRRLHAIPERAAFQAAVARSRA